MNKDAASRNPNELQPHQQRVRDRVLAGDDRLLLYHGLGTGKSRAALETAEAAGEPYAAIVPASLRPNMEAERAKWTNGRTPASVMSYTALANGKQPAEPPGTVIFDECLPAGSLIDGRPIESYRVGDSVLSFNHDTGLLERRVVSRTISRPTDVIARIDLASGVAIVCTPNHPVYTSRGYIAAEDLLAGDAVYRVDMISGPLSLITRTGATDEAKHRHYVRPVRQTVHGFQLPVYGAEALFDRMSKEGMGGGYAKNASHTHAQDSRKNAEQEPDVGRDVSQEDVGHVAEDWASTSVTRREWSRADQAGGGDGCGAGLGDLRDRTNRATRLLSDPLQDRRWASGTEDRGGNRWDVASFAAAPGSGREERYVLTIDWVDSVSVYERSSGPEFERLCPSGVVYDLTVDVNHNFFVDGYLVHNSHRLRNPNTSQARAAARLAAQANRVLMLSGSPIVNSPGDLATPLNMLAGTHYTPKSFEERYVGSEHEPRGLLGWLFDEQTPKQPVVAHAAELEKLLRNHVDYQPSKGPEGVQTHDRTVDVDLGQDQDRFNRMLYGKLPWLLRYKLRRQYPLSNNDLKGLTSFFTGSREAGLSMLPFGGATTPLEAFEGSGKLQVAGQHLLETLKDPRKKALVFSNFINAGLRPYDAFLAQHKVPHATFEGSLNDEQRRQAVADYNRGKLRVLLMGPSAAEGISTRGSQLIQIIDPHFNESRSQQARGRGLRFDSHAGLPEDLKNVDVERYVSHGRQPGWLGRLFGDEAMPTADEILGRMAAKKEETNELFRDLLRRVGTEKRGAVSMIADLKHAKRQSDRRNYPEKHKVLRRLLEADPGAFHIDSDQGHFYGLTHTDSGFKLHMPKPMVPAGVKRKEDKDKAAGINLAPIAIAEGLRPRRKQRPRAVKPVAAPEADEPAPMSVLEELVAARRARRSKVGEWERVPGDVMLRLKLGEDGPITAVQRALNGPSALSNALVHGAIGAGLGYGGGLLAETVARDLMPAGSVEHGKGRRTGMLMGAALGGLAWPAYRWSVANRAPSSPAKGQPLEALSTAWPWRPEDTPTPDLTV